MSDEETCLLGGIREKKGYQSAQDTQINLPGTPGKSSSSGSSKLPRLDKITYSWSNINVWVGSESKLDANSNSRIRNCCAKFSSKNGGESKQILKNVSGIVRPGELLAILGASGAGKTSLLSVLNFRNSNKLRVAGIRCANGIGIGPDMLTSLSAYVQQDDLFIPTLTVREHLIFQALVRMHSYIPKKQRMLRVEQVIIELGLTKCADTLIGNPGRVKGISGGEMKRLAFASEVLTDPPLMFCDEPTSGLDSYMAQNVVEVLKELARKGRTIITTIHQPSSEVYSLFDRVLLMANGRTAFLGSAKDAVEFFRIQGFPCPPNYNPADWFIQALAIQPGGNGNGNEEGCSRKRVEKICDNFEKSEAAQEIQRLAQPTKYKNDEFFEMEYTFRKRSPYKASWFAQFQAVFWRSWISLLKEPMIIRVRIIQTLVVSILIGALYFGQELTQDGVININGALFLFLTNMTFQNVFAVINVFCLELPIFLREHFNGMYRTDVYFLAKIFAELPLFVIFPVAFTSICYFVVQLNPDIYRFLTACGIVVLVANAASSFGYLISCLSSTVSMALALAPPFIIPLMLFGGFFLNKASIPVYFAWIKYGSWFLYGYELLCINQWDGVTTIECNRSNSTCPGNGDVILQTLNFDKNNFTFDLLALCGLVFGFRFIAFVALLSKTYRS